MKPPAFAYHDPRTVDEACALLAELDNAKLLAGGQSLMPMLNMRYVLPDHVVDLNRVVGLDQVRDTGAGLEIGALARQQDLLESALVRRRCPLLAAALAHVGHFQTRSRGTIGGSLAHLDPAAELLGVAAALDATLEVVGTKSRRTVPVADWGQGYMSPNLAPDEMLTKVILPVWPEPHGHAFIEFARRHGDFAIVGVAAAVALDTRGRIGRAAVAIVGVDVRPRRLSALEEALVGQAPDERSVAGAVAEMAPLDALGDAHVSGGYREKLARVLTRRALMEAAAHA
jgi:aerobic carbon-monoxide dehydrogenase medium subunit